MSSVKKFFSDIASGGSGSKSSKSKSSTSKSSKKVSTSKSSKHGDKGKNLPETIAFEEDVYEHNVFEFVEFVDREAEAVGKLDEVVDKALADAEGGLLCSREICCSVGNCGQVGIEQTKLIF